MPGAWRDKKWRYHGAQPWHDGRSRGDQPWHDGRSRGDQQWHVGSDERGRSRSLRSHYRRYSGRRQPAIDERRVALFGDNRVGRHAFPNGEDERCEPRLPQRPGRRPLVVRWFRPKGSVPPCFTGEGSEAWVPLARAVVRMNDFPVLPDYAVISVSAMALTNKPAYYDDPVSLRSDAREAAGRVTAGVDSFLDVTRMCVPGVCPLVFSVVPDLNALPETTLSACRRLSASLWEIARQKDALFIDVEEVVRRYMAAQERAVRGPTFGQEGDAAARTAPAPCGDKAATEPVAEQQEAASKPREAGDGLLAAVGAELREPGAKMQQELRQKLRQELRQELMKELRQPPVGDVPWQSGWAPGQPPPVCLSAPPLPPHVYELDCSSCLNSMAYKAIRLEILRIASS